jgi:hypothetical protein
MHIPLYLRVPMPTPTIHRFPFDDRLYARLSESTSEYFLLSEQVKHVLGSYLTEDNYYRVLGMFTDRGHVVSFHSPASGSSEPSLIEQIGDLDSIHRWRRLLLELRNTVVPHNILWLLALEPPDPDERVVDTDIRDGVLVVRIEKRDTSGRVTHSRTDRYSAENVLKIAPPSLRRRLHWLHTVPFCTDPLLFQFWWLLDAWHCYPKHEQSTGLESLILVDMHV